MIGRVSGAPVILTPSWFLAAAILTVLFAPTVENLAPHLGNERYVVSFAFVLLLFASVFLHEVAHALVARARGQHVTELAVTLWGGHTAYSGTSARPLDGFLISVVGPLTNLALAVGSGIRYAVIEGGPNGAADVHTTPDGTPDEAFEAVAHRYLLAEDLLPNYAKDLGYESADAARAAMRTGLSGPRSQRGEVCGEVADIVVRECLHDGEHHAGVFAGPLARPISPHCIFQIERILAGNIRVAWDGRDAGGTMT